MNYIDKYYFTFPMKVYDGFSLRRAKQREEDTDVPTDGEWAEGICRLPIDEIEGWFDVFSKGRTVEDVYENGFDYTIILTKTKGEFECTWPRKRFEKEFEEAMERYQNCVKNDLQTIMSDFNSGEVKI